MTNAANDLRRVMSDTYRLPCNHNEMMTLAAAALAVEDGDAFDSLLAVNEGWLQTEDETLSMRRLLNSMQEAAYLLADRA